VAAKAAADETKAHGGISMILVECHFRQGKKSSSKAGVDRSPHVFTLANSTTGISLVDNLALFVWIYQPDVLWQCDL